MSFTYDADWLGWDQAMQVSISPPIRDETYRGAPVINVFKNRLPGCPACTGQFGRAAQSQRD
ncbi:MULTISPECIES: HipA N-terminal domain-containing protein [Hyphomonas]|uniref:HipA N-terminal domain-containing protein n=1 Tax=Hyphomonas TaxID=85 RepID=UPI0009DD3693